MEEIIIVNGIDYIEEVRELIKEYSIWLGRDLSFQNIDEELKDPSFKYTPPEGELLVAIKGKEVVGTVAYHRHNEVRCEMKRLYVKDFVRGLKVGERLAKEIMNHAKAAGYKEMVLDTIIPLKAAIHLYEKLGFKRCEPYYNNPMDDVLYYKKEL